MEFPIYSMQKHRRKNKNHNKIFIENLTLFEKLSLSLMNHRFPLFTIYLDFDIFDFYILSIFLK